MNKYHSTLNGQMAYVNSNNMYVEALISNLRLKFQTYDVTKYKTKHKSLTNAKKQNQNIPRPSLP